MRNLVDIRAALETALAAMTPNMPTAWENVEFIPVNNVAYQTVNLLVATPLNSEMGSSYIEQGIFQVTLMYPLMAGVAEVTSRTRLLRDTFFRGKTLVSNDEKVVIERTPEVSAGRRDGDRWAVPVKIRWIA